MSQSSLVLSLAVGTVLAWPGSAGAQRCPFSAWAQVQVQIQMQRQAATAHWQIINNRAPAMAPGRAIAHHASSACSNRRTIPGSSGRTTTRESRSTTTHAETTVHRVTTVSRITKRTFHEIWWFPRLYGHRDPIILPWYHAMRWTQSQHLVMHASLERMTTYSSSTRVERQTHRANGAQPRAILEPNRAVTTFRDLTPEHKSQTPTYVQPAARLVETHNPLVKLRITWIGPGTQPVVARLPQPGPGHVLNGNRPGPGLVVNRPQLPLLDRPVLPQLADLPGRPGLDWVIAGKQDGQPTQRSSLDPTALSPGSQTATLQPAHPPLPALEGGVFSLDALKRNQGTQEPSGDQTPLALLLPADVAQAPSLPVLPGMQTFDRGLLPGFGKATREKSFGGEGRSSSLELVLQRPPLPEVEIP